MTRPPVWGNRWGEPDPAALGATERSSRRRAGLALLGTLVVLLVIARVWL